MNKTYPINDSPLLDVPYVLQLKGYAVSVQSCWLDKDTHIVGNIAITRYFDSNDKPILKSWPRTYSIELSKVGELNYPGFVSKRVAKDTLTYDEYDKFFRENIQAITALLVSLLRPEELKEWEREGRT